MADNYIFDLDPGVTRTPVSYTNRYAITISADLYRPAEFDESRRTRLIGCRSTSSKSSSPQTAPAARPPSPAQRPSGHRRTCEQT